MAKEISWEDFRKFLEESLGLGAGSVEQNFKIVDLTNSLGLMYFALQVHERYGVELPLRKRGFNEETTAFQALGLINQRRAA